MIVDNGKYYLYRHIRIDTNEVFYVGIGTKRGKHYTDYISAYYRAFTKDSRTNYWFNIVNKTSYEVEIILESNDKEFIYSKEREFINLYGRKDLNTGPLVNLDDGGKHGINRSPLSTQKAIATKRRLGLSNAVNLENWLKSPNYKNPKAKYIYLYSARDGALIKKFNSLKLCAEYLNIKGSVSHIINACNRRRVYISKYIFSWHDQGSFIDLSGYNLNDVFYQSVAKLCYKTKAVISLYDSMSEAAKKSNTTLRNISEAVLEKGSAAGFYWVLQSEIDRIGEMKFKKHKNPGIVRVNTDGKNEYFKSSRAIAKAMNVHKSTILRSIHNKSPLNGYVINFAS